MRLIQSLLPALSIAILTGPILPAAHAADGVWINPVTGGLWGTGGNWDLGNIADGSGSTANFSTIDLTADNTVQLNAPRTIGNLIFGDSDTGTAAGWILSNNAVAGNILTFDGTTPTITVNALGTGKNVTISAVVAGTAGLTKAGTGTLRLSGLNPNLTGGINVNAGELAITGAGTVASSNAINIASGATFRDSTSAGQTWGTLTGAGIFIRDTGTVLQTFGDLTGFTGTMNFTSGLNFFTAATMGSTSANFTTGSGSAGEIVFATGTYTINLGSLTGSGNVRTQTSGSGGTVTVSLGANNADTTFSGVLSQSTSVLALTKVGTGTTTLAGANTFNGATTVSAGTLKLSNSLALQNSTLTNGGTGIVFDSSVGSHAFTFGGLSGSGDLALVDNSSNAVTLSVGSNNAATAYSGVLSGTGALTKIGTGTLTLSGPNTYGGATTINGTGTGTYTALKVSSDTALGSTAGGTTLNGGTATTTNGTVLELGAGVTVTGESLTMNGATGRATLLLNTAGSAAWNGNITISNSTQIVAINSSIVGANLTIGASSSNTLTLTGPNNYIRGGAIGTINSTITGTGSLSKTDSGTWTIANADNDYSGNSTVNLGVLSIGKIADGGQTSSIGTASSITLGQNSGVGTLQFTGTSGGSSNRNIVLNNGASGGGGIIENTVAGQTLTLSGSVTSVTPASASSLTLQGAGSGVLSGSITGSPATAMTKAGAGTWTVSGANTHTGLTTITGGILSVGTIADAGSSNLGITGGVTLNGGKLQYTAVGATTTTARVFSANNTAASGIEISDVGTTLAINGGFAGNAGGTVTKTGLGVLTLTGTTDNSSLIFNVTDGTLNLEKNGAATSRALAGISGLASGALVKLTGTGTDQIYGGSASGASGLVNMTGGTLDLNAHSESLSRLTGTGTVTTSAVGAATLTLGETNGTSAFGGSIQDGSGTVSLAKIGTGILTLSGANSYTGITSIAAGTLAVSHADALGGTTTGTGVTSGAILQLTGGVTTNAGETVTLNGAGNNFGALQSGTGGGTWAGGITLGDATIRLGALAGNTLTVTGSINDGGGTSFFVSGQSGTGVVIINPTTSNSYTGTTGVFRGILRIGKNDALPTGTVLDVDAANGVTDAVSFDLASFNQTVGALQDTATTNLGSIVTNSVATTTSTLTVNGTANTTFNGVIENGAGTVALKKNGSGILTLAGVNTYTGATNIDGGTLLVSGSLTGSAVTVNGGILGGNGGTVGATTINSGGTLSPGASIGTLNLGALSLAAGSTFALEIDSTGMTTDLAAAMGNLSIAATNNTVLSITDLNAAAITTGVFEFITYTGTWDGGLFTVSGNIIDDYDPILNPSSASFVIAGNSYQIDYNAGGDAVALLAVPEPATGTALMGGLGLLLGLRRRRE